MTVRLPTRKELLELQSFLTEDERVEIDHLLAGASHLGRWAPLPGRQTEALESQADELFYGGAAGGGKTDLLLGAAFTQHHRAIIFRREYPQLKGIEDRSRELYTGLGSYNANDKVWRFPGGKRIEFGAVQSGDAVQKYQGRAHDLKGFDEITTFSEAQYRFLIGWLRTVKSGQRKRVIATGNPPFTEEGKWVIRYWGPWLDKFHPNPARPGELRWFAVIDGADVEVDGPQPFRHGGDLIRPLSRTFIPARVDDNPFLMETGYKSRLQQFPEPLRSMMLEGAFGIAQEDDPWQVIPTAWVEAAQARWKPRPIGQLKAVGIDVARGGKDRTVFAPLEGVHVHELRVWPGAETRDGHAVCVQLGLLPGMADRTMVNIDVVGVGSAVYDIARQAGFNAFGLNGGAGSSATDRSGFLGFANLRAEWYWKFREALDPDSGQAVELPPGREVLADLCAARWKSVPRGIAIESKDDIIERIGRSPDLADAIVYAFAQPFVVGQALMDFYRGDSQ